MKANVSWVNNLTFMGHSESGHKILMDGDQGEGAPSPMEMVLMAAGSCSAVDVVGILKKTRQQVHNIDVELSAQRADEAPKVFTKVHMKFIITGIQVSAKHVARAVSLSADKYCSVAKMLEQTAEVTHSYEIIDVDQTIPQ